MELDVVEFTGLSAGAERSGGTSHRSGIFTYLAPNTVDAGERILVTSGPIAP
jgi:hypothetical protein